MGFYKEILHDECFKGANVLNYNEMTAFKNGFNEVSIKDYFRVITLKTSN